MDPEINQTITQKQITFAQDTDMVLAAVQIIKDCTGVHGLVGDSEFSTLVNAITLDTQQNVLTKFLSRIDHIKNGGLLNEQTQ